MSVRDSVENDYLPFVKKELRPRGYKDLLAHDDLQSLQEGNASRGRKGSLPLVVPFVPEQFSSPLAPGPSNTAPHPRITILSIKNHSSEALLTSSLGRFKIDSCSSFLT
jgi:hypothetical protein